MNEWIEPIRENDLVRAVDLLLTLFVCSSCLIVGANNISNVTIELWLWRTVQHSFIPPNELRSACLYPRPQWMRTSRSARSALEDISHRKHIRATYSATLVPCGTLASARGSGTGPGPTDTNRPSFNSFDVTVFFSLSLRHSLCNKQGGVMVTRAERTGSSVWVPCVRVRLRACFHHFGWKRVRIFRLRVPSLGSTVTTCI